jgi:two-component system, LytTR family, sensor kinase
VIRYPACLLIAEACNTESSTIEKCVEFGIGTALATLLLILALRSTGESRTPRLSFAVCSLVFTLAACVAQVSYGLTQSLRSPIVVLASDIAFCATASWPVPILALWAQGPYSSQWRRKLGQVLIATACASAFTLSLAHIAGLLNAQIYDRGIDGPMHWLLPTGYNGLFFLWLGAFVFLPGRLKDRLSWISVAAMLAGITCATLRGLEEDVFGNYPLWLHFVVSFVRPVSVPFMVAGGLFGFSRFRFTDIFAQTGLRILLGALLALACSFIARAIFGSPLGERTHSTGLAVLAFGAVAWLIIVGYAKIAAISDWLVDRQIFRQAGYHRALKSFREAIATESDPVKVLETGKELAKETLRIADADVRPIDGPGESDHPFSYECADEYVFRISKGDDRPAYSLVISPGRGRHILFNAEIDFLREICLVIGRRLEAIDREKENIERAGREAHLVKQLVEAELRALRSQINPHFLFNSLNSIAALIAAEPQAAEEMTIRLAKIFRHVLTYHDRPFSSVNEEISFLQTYLEIEKVRFGDRLQVNFEIEASVAHLSVPTLILQPLVENSIKHGLGPKVGENLLTIRARHQANYLELTVEDNGIGANVRKKLPSQNSTGLGLRNVEERLQTVYRGAAQFCFESVPRMGSRAQILIPIARKNLTRSEVADTLRVGAR